MNSSILITKYLAKDIWKGWLVTPSAFLARLVIAGLLCVAYINLKAGFIIAEQQLEQKIKSLGIDTLVVRAQRDSIDDGNPDVDQLLQPIKNTRLFAPFKASFSRSEIIGGGYANLVFYDNQSIKGLSDFIPEAKHLHSDLFVVTNKYPAHSIARVKVDQRHLDAEVLPKPENFSLISNIDSAVFLPHYLKSKYLNRRFIDCVLIKLENVDELEATVESIKTTLRNEDYVKIEINSSVGFIQELENLRMMKNKAELALSTFLALMIIVIFGSFSIFEYRQNIYITALIRSFGVSSYFLAIRYLVESLLILSISLLLALAFIHYSQDMVTSLFDSQGNAKILRFDVWASQYYDTLAWILIASGIASLVPIVFALRVKVGETLD